MTLIHKKILGVNTREVQFDIRGFRLSSPQKREHFENIGKHFLLGYHQGLQFGNNKKLVPILEHTENKLKGFVYEGAAMALALRDFLSPFRNHHLQNFMEKEANKHIYMLHVGAGWAFAKLPISVEKIIHKFDPLLKWLIIDGYGFHQAYFKTKSYVQLKKIPTELSPFAQHVFYQGVGRCLWFVECACPTVVAKTIGAFPSKFQPDLWAGIGLACTYAEGAISEEIVQLKQLAANFQSHLAQGAAFAAKTRLRAGNASDYTDQCCQILCETDCHTAANFTDQALNQIDFSASEEQYEQWRSLIRLQVEKQKTPNSPIR